MSSLSESLSGRFMFAVQPCVPKVVNNLPPYPFCSTSPQALLPFLALLFFLTSEFFFIFIKVIYVHSFKNQIDPQGVEQKAAVPCFTLPYPKPQSLQATSFLLFSLKMLVFCKDNTFKENAFNTV